MPVHKLDMDTMVTTTWEKRSSAAATGTMQTFVMKRIGEVGLMEKAVPEPVPNDAIVKTTAALICTSDTHTVKGAIGERNNLTLGHPSSHPVWGGPGWKVFLETADDIRRTIRYIERNPIPYRLPVQQHAFVDVYEGWDLSRAAR